MKAQAAGGEPNLAHVSIYDRGDGVAINDVLYDRAQPRRSPLRIW
jgi:hypothetical protein